jgi:pantoate--beta-alanine ligase
MRMVRRVGAMQRLASGWRRVGCSLAFVPTMGCLHAGHMSLVHRARQLAGARGKVLVSIFVNPTQFGPNEDFKKYPRTLSRDARLCREAGVDVVFAPSAAEMYPAEEGQPFSTYVVEESLTEGMESATRPTHFRGVTTVLAKLFNIVDPTVAVFGQKDFQQAAVVRRMIRDLNFRVRLVVAPTVREPDGLAMSSRNQYLSAPERAQAVALWEAIQLVRRLVRASEKSWPAASLRGQIQEMLKLYPAAQLDYVAFFDPVSLKAVETVSRGTQVALAMYLGKTRLIDNARL